MFGERYPEVAQLAISADQDLGMVIAFKQAANSKFTTATTPGEFVRERIRALFEDAAVAHVSGEQLNRISEALKIAFSQDDVTKLNAVATALGVDLTVTPPNAK